MASKRHQRRRSCEGKVAYTDQTAASQAAIRLRASHHGGTWAAYRCSFCGSYHVGRQSAKNRRAMRDRRAAAAE